MNTFRFGKGVFLKICLTLCSSFWFLDALKPLETSPHYHIQTEVTAKNVYKTTTKSPTTSTTSTTSTFTYFFQSTFGIAQVSDCYYDGKWCSDPDWVSVIEVKNVKDYFICQVEMGTNTQTFEQFLIIWTIQNNVYDAFL